MRRVLITTLVTAVALAGCGRGDGEGGTAETAAPAPPTEARQGMEGMAPHAPMEVPTEVTLDEAVRAAWRGVRVKVVDLQSGESATHDLALGEAVPLGDTGLVATALVFVPDFVMDDRGITTRSPEPNNPAVRVRIEEEGKPPYEGWLFAAMPEIHPYPHERYQVLLVEGIPAGD